MSVMKSTVVNITFKPKVIYNTPLWYTGVEVKKTKPQIIPNRNIQSYWKNSTNDLTWHDLVLEKNPTMTGLVWFDFD